MELKVHKSIVDNAVSTALESLVLGDSIEEAKKKIKESLNDCLGNLNINNFTNYENYPLPMVGERFLIYFQDLRHSNPYEQDIPVIATIIQKNAGHSSGSYGFPSRPAELYSLVVLEVGDPAPSSGMGSHIQAHTVLAESEVLNDIWSALPLHVTRIDLAPPEHFKISLQEIIEGAYPETVNMLTEDGLITVPYDNVAMRENFIDDEDDNIPGLEDQQQQFEYSQSMRDEVLNGHIAAAINAEKEAATRQLENES